MQQLKPCMREHGFNGHTDHHLDLDHINAMWRYFYNVVKFWFERETLIERLALVNETR